MAFTVNLSSVQNIFLSNKTNDVIIWNNKKKMKIKTKATETWMKSAKLNILLHRTSKIKTFSIECFLFFLMFSILYCNQHLLYLFHPIRHNQSIKSLSVWMRYLGDLHFVIRLPTKYMSSGSCRSAVLMFRLIKARISAPSRKSVL